jgi:hypothetical protein
LDVRAALWLGLIGMVHWRGVLRCWSLPGAFIWWEVTDARGVDVVAGVFVDWVEVFC